MTIKLIDHESHNKLAEIKENYPALTLQNKGYEGIDKSKFTKQEEDKFNQVNER